MHYRPKRHLRDWPGLLKKKVTCNDVAMSHLLCFRNKVLIMISAFYSKIYSVTACICTAWNGLGSDCFFVVVVVVVVLVGSADVIYFGQNSETGIVVIC